MPDDKMFARLMESSPQTNLAPQGPQLKVQTRQVHFALGPEDIQAVDNYFTKLYPTELRATKSQIVSLAIQVLDRVLKGTAPTDLNVGVLDEYVRTHRHTDIATPGHTDVAPERRISERPEGRNG